MKKTILLFTLFFMALSIGFSQNPGDRFQKIKSQKVAFLTEKMDLTVEEAKDFWPLYNAYEKSVQELNRSNWTRGSEGKKNAEMTDEKAEEILTSSLDRQSKELQLKKEFYVKAAKVVSYKKLLRMGRGEREFRQNLFGGYKSHQNRGKK